MQSYMSARMEKRLGELVATILKMDITESRLMNTPSRYGWREYSLILTRAGAEEVIYMTIGKVNHWVDFEGYFAEKLPGFVKYVRPTPPPDLNNGLTDSLIDGLAMFLGAETPVRIMRGRKGTKADKAHLVAGYLREKYHFIHMVKMTYGGGDYELTAAGREALAAYVASGRIKLAKPSEAQTLRQRDRNNGKYAEMDTCDVCGKRKALVYATDDGGIICEGCSAKA